MPFDNTKPNTGQTIGDVIVSTLANLIAIYTELTVHTANDADAHGIDALITAAADYAAHKANITTAHGIDIVSALATAVNAEIVAARGSLPTLATRLAAALQADGSIRLSTLNNKWINNSDTPTYISPTSFSVPGDRTPVYIAGVQLRFTISGSYGYGPVASCSYSGGITTVVIDPAYPILTSGVSGVDIGLIAWDNAVALAATQNAADIVNVQGQVTSLKIEQIEDWIAGKPGAGAVVKRFIAARPFSIPSAIAGALAKADVVATASSVFTLAKNAAPFGTMTFSAAATVPTWAAATATSFAAGDVLTITAPGSQDATLADIAYYIPGVLP